MTRNLLGAKNKKYFKKKKKKKKKKKLIPTSTPKIPPKMYVLRTAVYKRFKRTLVSSNWLK